jgi:membrane protease YdiL (CAAX protease family)
MVQVDRAAGWRHRLSPHLRGHLFLFDAGAGPSHGADTGARVLLATFALEIVRIAAVRWLTPITPLWLLMTLLLGLAMLAIPVVTGWMPSHFGFRRWRHWTATEKSYFLQVLVLANVVFPMVLAAPMRERLAQGSLSSALWSGFVPYLFYGFYQELVYRGMLQQELVRRWGPCAGVLSANLLYTFGPLHTYHLASPASVAAPMFAAIFLIGLFFGVLLQRSRNLWMVAIFHALGNAYIAGSLG